MCSGARAAGRLNAQPALRPALRHPGKINVATVGAGSLQHLTAVYFNMMTGLDLVPVHYRGAAPAITDLIAGL
jgi:tripartite-type tricarboxylate transporter receptor subunit TctC